MGVCGGPMQRLFHRWSTPIFAILFCLSQDASAQDVVRTAAIQTGFAVVTPLLGGGQGVTVSEIFSHRLDGNLFQASVPSSPPVTFTNLAVRLDANAGTDTGIAIVNLSVSPATITLTLRNEEGGSIAVRIVTIGGRQQLSRFVTQLFLGVRELASPFEGSLFIRSTAPVGVLGLNFVGPSFTASEPPAGGPVVFRPPDTGVSAASFLLLPQIVSGGGWSSRIVIANTSTVPQLVRVDFFNSAGQPLVLPLAANPPILVPARGVVTVPAME